MENLKSIGMAAALALSACSPDSERTHPMQVGPEELDLGSEPIAEVLPTDEDTPYTTPEIPTDTGTDTPPPHNYNDTQLLFHEVFVGLIGDQPGQGIDGTACAIFRDSGQPEQLECFVPGNEGKEIVIDGFVDLVNERIGKQLTFEQVSNLDGTGPMLVLYNKTKQGIDDNVIYILPATEELIDRLEVIDWDLGNPGFLPWDYEFLNVQRAETWVHHGIFEGYWINSHQTLKHQPEFIDTYGNRVEEQVELYSSQDYYGFHVADRPDLDIAPMDEAIHRFQTRFDHVVDLLQAVEPHDLKLNIQQGPLPGDLKGTEGRWYVFK